MKRGRLVMLATLVAVLTLSLVAVVNHRRAPAVDSAVPAAPGLRAPAPRFIGGASSGTGSTSTVSDSGSAPMPEGLAQDLAMFDSAQLRAELQSIVLSHPDVSIVSVSCDARPCLAEVQVDEDETPKLDAFLAATSARFKGYLTATFSLTPADDDAVVRAAIVIGVSGPHPPPRYR